MTNDQADALGTNILKAMKMFTDARYLVQKYTPEEFRKWCRSDYLTKKDVHLFDKTLEDFEKYEFYEYCKIIKEEKERFIIINNL